MTCAGTWSPAHFASRAHQLLRERPTWWEPGAVTIDGRDPRKGYAPGFYRIAAPPACGGLDPETGAEQHRAGDRVPRRACFERRARDRAPLSMHIAPE